MVVEVEVDGRLTVDMCVMWMWIRMPMPMPMPMPIGQHCRCGKFTTIPRNVARIAFAVVSSCQRQVDYVFIGVERNRQIKKSLELD